MPFDDLCRRCEAVLHASPASTDTDLVQALSAVEGDVPLLGRVVRAVRRSDNASLWALPSRELTVEGARLLAGPRASEADRTRAFLDWIHQHKDDPPPAWFCVHVPPCPSIRFCLVLDDVRGS